MELAFLVRYHHFGPVLLPLISKSDDLALTNHNKVERVNIYFSRNSSIFAMGFLGDLG